MGVEWLLGRSRDGAQPFEVCAEAPGFVPQCHPDLLPFDSPVTASEPRDFVLQPIGDAVRGHVLLSDGNTCAEEVEVVLLDETFAEVSRVKANVLGGYVLTELGPQRSPRFTFEARCATTVHCSQRPHPSEARRPRRPIPAFRDKAAE